MNKKGFTLIELLAVIIILGVIALIAIPTVNTIIKTSRNSASITTAENIISAVEQDCNLRKVKGQTTQNVYKIVDGKISPSVNIKGKLIDNAIISVNEDCDVDFYGEDDDYIITKSSTSDEVEGTSSSETRDGKIKYNLVDSLNTTYLGIVYLDPTDSSKTCTKDNYSSANTTSGCMRFYIFKDNYDGTVEAMLDHSVGNGFWRTDADGYGPSTGSGSILKVIKDATSSWSVIADRTDKYVGSYLGHKYTIDYTGYKARLITAEEIATITGNSKFDVGDQLTNYKLDTNSSEGLKDTSTSKYLWIVSSQVNSIDQPGLWTASSTDNNTEDLANKNVWILSQWSISIGLDYAYMSDSTPYRGARPVITISKSLYE